MPTLRGQWQAGWCHKGCTNCVDLGARLEVMHGPNSTSSLSLRRIYLLLLLTTQTKSEPLICNQPSRRLSCLLESWSDWICFYYFILGGAAFTLTGINLYPTYRFAFPGFRAYSSLTVQEDTLCLIHWHGIPHACKWPHDQTSPEKPLGRSLCHLEEANMGHQCRSDEGTANALACPHS